MSILVASQFDSFWGVLLWMLTFFLFFGWLLVAFQVIGDIFRRDVSGWNKALWCLAVIFFPLLGVLIYLIIHGNGMARRDVADAQAQDAAATAYIRQAAGNSGPADQLKALKAMHEAGELSDADYAKAKSKVLD